MFELKFESRDGAQKHCKAEWTMIHAMVTGDFVRFAGEEKIRQYTFPSVGKILFRTKEAAEEAWNELAAAKKKK